MGGWQYINESPAKFQAVTAADIQRVANTYFDWKNRNVAIYLRKAGATPDDPELAALPADVQSDARGMLQQILQQNDPALLRQIIGQIEQMKSQLPGRDDVPAGTAQALDYVIKKVNERIVALEAGDTSTQDSPATAPAAEPK